MFYLLENYLEILACCQVSDRCPLGYLFYVKWQKKQILYIITKSAPDLLCSKIILGRDVRKPTFWFPTWSDTHQAVQLQKMARALKVEGLYYLCRENKGADQLRGYREADLRLCFSHMQNAGFLMTRLILGHLGK